MSQIGLMRLFKGAKIDDLTISQVEETLDDVSLSRHILKGAAALGIIAAGSVASQTVLADESPAVETEVSTDTLVGTDVVTMPSSSTAIDNTVQQGGKESPTTVDESSLSLSTSESLSSSISLSESQSLSESLSESAFESVSESMSDSSSASSSESQRQAEIVSESITSSEHQSLSTSETTSSENNVSSETTSKVATGSLRVAKDALTQAIAASDTADTSQLTETERQVYTDKVVEAKAVLEETENLLASASATQLQIDALTQRANRLAKSLQATTAKESNVTVRTRRATTGTDVTAQLNITSASLVNGSSRTLGDTIVNTGSGESFVYNLTFTIPSVNEGDHFTIQLSDTLDATGTSVLSDVVTIKSGDTVYATGVYDDATKTITYTFTAEAAAKSNLEASVSMPLFVDDITVPNTTSSATFTVTVNGNTQSLTEGVNYDAVHHSLNAYNISSRIVETNNKDNSLKFVAGINTDGSSIYNSQGLVSRVVTSSGTVEWDNATLKIYQTSPSSVYDSLHNDTSKLTDVTDEFSITRVNGTDRYNVAMDGYLINWEPRL